jgi:hypothetical protein
VFVAIGVYAFLSALRKRRQLGTWGMYHHFFGLPPEERLRELWQCFEYHGDLVPSTLPSSGEKVKQVALQAAGLALGSVVTFRPPRIMIALTDRGRLAVAREPDASLRSFTPMAVFPAGSAILVGAEAFPGHPIPNGPVIGTALFQVRPTTLMRIAAPGDGPTYTFWCHPHGVERVRNWARECASRAATEGGDQ